MTAATPAPGPSPAAPGALSHDDRWPRAGDWPTPDALAADEHARVAVVGIPTWRTSLSATGAGTTPAAVRAAVRRYSTYAGPVLGADGGVDLSDVRIVDAGDIEEPDGPEGEGRATAAVAALAARAGLVVALGGDNAATVPAALGAWGDQVGRAGLVTFDAHHDLRDGVSNGSPVRRLVELGLAGTRVVQIGISDFANSREYAARARDLGITVISRGTLHRRPVEDLTAEALEIAASAGGPVHVDVDVDVCDRAVAPACPASVPGGLSADELRRAVRTAATDARVTSLDLVEVDAGADTPDGRTVRLTALCLLEAAVGAALRHG